MPPPIPPARRLRPLLAPLPRQPGGRPGGASARESPGTAGWPRMGACRGPLLPRAAGGRTGGLGGFKGKVGSPTVLAAPGRPSFLEEPLPPTLRASQPRKWLPSRGRVVPSSGRSPGARPGRGAASGEASRGGGGRAGQTGLWRSQGALSPTPTGGGGGGLEAPRVDSLPEFATGSRGGGGARAGGARLPGEVIHPPPPAPPPARPVRRQGAVGAGTGLASAADQKGWHTL